MRIRSTGTEVGLSEDGNALVCGVLGKDSLDQGHFLTFQRDAEDSDEDLSVYVEYNDQTSGGYNSVSINVLSDAR